MAWRRQCVLLCVCAALTGCGPSNEQPKPVAAATPKAAAVPTGKTEAAEKAPEPQGPSGWLATIAAPGAPAAEWVKTWSPSAAMALGEGQTIHPAIPAAGFTVGYAGEVAIEEPGRYRFAVHTQGGSAKLSVSRGASSLGQATLTQDQSVMRTEWMQLSPGAAMLSVSFTRVGAGPARVRAMWEKEGAGDKGFREEAIPPTAVTVAKYGVKDAAVGKSALRGRVLLGELNCVSCHAASEAAVTARSAPLMGEIGRRASAEWLLKWVHDPQGMKPGSGMPTVFGASEQDKTDSESVVHYLMSLGNVPEWQAAATEADGIDQGRKLYHSVGCVACHGALDDPAAVFGEQAVGPRTGGNVVLPPESFGTMARKWRPAGLSEFLKDPVRTHPGGRMPSMSLKDVEADLIATYLANSWNAKDFKPAEFKPDPAKVETGKAVFAARGCASCHHTGHELPDVASTLSAKPLADVKSGAGCLDSKDASTPRYALSDVDRSDLVAGIAEAKRITGKNGAAPIDAGQRLVGALGCVNCHEMDGIGGPADNIKSCFRTIGEVELGDEGRFPPRLTGVGMKLQTSWLKQVMAEAGRARPYMATRMPQYGAKTIADLPAALAHMEGVLPETDARGPQVSDALVLAGRKLVGDKALNCITCHSYAGKIAGTAGPDITHFASRLRYEWWKPYLMAPARFKPGTRMTPFFADGRGKITDVFGGDADRQADSLWAYFTTTGGSGPEPEGLPAAGGLPLIVGDRPTVFRTFMKDAGSRGIAVGYPIGFHFAFDATAVRLVDAWKGDFLDATSAWKGRGGQVATGQGKTIWSAPAGPAIVIAPSRPEKWPEGGGRDAGYRFEGYRLTDKGVPVFMYKAGSSNVEEIVEPGESGQIRRSITVKGVPAGAVVWFNTGPGVVSSTAVANIASDRAAGDNKLKLEGYTPKDYAQPVSFEVVIKP